MNWDMVSALGAVFGAIATSSAVWLSLRSYRPCLSIEPLPIQGNTFKVHLINTGLVPVCITRIDLEYVGLSKIILRKLGMLPQFDTDYVLGSAKDFGVHGHNDFITIGSGQSQTIELRYAAVTSKISSLYDHKQLESNTYPAIGFYALTASGKKYNFNFDLDLGKYFEKYGTKMY